MSPCGSKPLVTTKLRVIRVYGTLTDSKVRFKAKEKKETISSIYDQENMAIL